MQGSSYIDSELKAKPEMSLEYIIAPPRMALYMEYSTRIYNIYLKYIAPEDIHVYSIDEVFMDVTDYLQTYKLTPHELAMKMIQEVLQETGITATAGIGTNLYLCKVAMDIVAKHIPADKDGVRIAELDEMSYRKLLWSHTPLTDFWRIGQHAHGTANLTKYSASSRAITRAVLTVMERVVDKNLLIRRIGISANRVIRECDAVYENVCEQLDFFSDISEQEKNHEREERDEQRERSMQQAILKMKKKYGKNAVMRGMNYQEGATAIERNGQVGGHKA